MALTKIVDCYLYCGFTEDAQACFDFKKWLEDNNVDFQLLFYADNSQHKGVFDALNSWWPDLESENKLSKFPIFVYTEIHDDLTPAKYPRKFFKSTAEIQTSNFLTQYQLGR